MRPWRIAARRAAESAGVVGEAAKQAFGEREWEWAGEGQKCLSFRCFDGYFGSFLGVLFFKKKCGGSKKNVWGVKKNMFFLGFRSSKACVPLAAASC